MLDEPSKPFHWGNEGSIAFNKNNGRIINMDDTISPPSNDHVAFEPKNCGQI